MKRSTYIKNKYKRSEQLLIGDRVYISNAPIEQRHRNGLKGTIISFQVMPPIFKNKVAEVTFDDYSTSVWNVSRLTKII